MPDLSQLKLQDEGIVPDFDNYVEASEFPPPLPEGIYTFLQGKPTFEATKDGFLSVNFADGHKLADDPTKSACRFDRVSAKVFERQGVKVSMLADHVRALGDNSRPRTNSDFATIVEAGEGKPFKGQIVWEGYCKGTDKDGHDLPVAQGYSGHVRMPDNSLTPVNIKGARSFVNGSGHPSDIIPCPKCGNDVRARERITRRLPA